MSHELDQNVATGRAAVFSVRETPWHAEGFTLPEPPTFEEGLRLAGVDYEVRTVPLFTKVPAGHEAASADGMDGIFKRTERGMAIMRTDRWTVLGVRSEQYAPLQNRDAFAPLIPLLDSGVATLETGGALRGGQDAWLMAKFDIKDPVVQEVFADEVVPFALFTNNHSGSRRAWAMETPVRVVCANTLAAAFGGMRRDHAVQVVHRGDAKLRMVEAAEKLFNGITDRYVRIAMHYQTLKARVLTEMEFERAVLDVVAPKLDADQVLALSKRGMDTVLRRVEERRVEVRRLWEGGTGHTGDHSAWEAWNGAVEALDHDRELFPVRGSRVESLMKGRLVSRKEQVLGHLVALAARN